MSTVSVEADQCISIPRQMLDRLIQMADTHVQDVAEGLADHTYERADNPTHEADVALMALAKTLADGTVVLPVPFHGQSDAKIAVVVKGGEVAQVLSDKSGVTIAVIEYGQQAADDLVMIPTGRGGFAKGWAGICDAELRPDRASELFAVAQSASIEGVVREGIHNGTILSQAAGVVTQRVDREGNTVKHLAANLNRAVGVGDVLDIRYSNGVGQVSGHSMAKELGR